MRRTCLARRLCLGLALLLAAGCIAWPASKPKLKVVTVRKVPPIGPPVWRVDLRAFGYADHVDQEVKMPNWTTRTIASGQSVFVDQCTLLVTFVRRVPSPMTMRDLLQETSTLRLQGVFFQADSGQVVSQRDWETSSALPHVVTGCNGKFVLRLGERLVLYSSAAGPLKELELPRSSKPSKVDFWRTERSPSGKTVWLVHIQTSQCDYYTLDSETLILRESWSGPDLPFSTVADDKLAWRHPHKFRVPSATPSVRVAGSHHKTTSYGEGTVVVRRLGGAWTVACKGSSCGIPHFVNNDVLALDPVGWGFRLVGADGQPLSPEFRIGDIGRGPWDDARMAGVLRTSERGDRLAVPLFLPYDAGYSPGTGGQYFFLSLSGMPIAPLFGGSQPSILWEHDRYKSNLFRIPVLDLPSRQWIAALEAYEYNIEQICDAALSPDGTLLALFRQEGIVEVYPLPASTAAPPGSQVK